ncbi:MAG: CDP-archaeol synthase [Pirellulaceae bacterium]
MIEPEPIACAIFLMTAFVVAGFAQSFWLRSDWSKRFQHPIDGGVSFRGKRIFGDNKTWRGFIAIVPSVSLAFVAVRLPYLLSDDLSGRLWPLSLFGYALLGLVAGTGFMIGELPNSFMKRQLDIPPGAAPQAVGTRWICFIIDRLDSILSGMLFLAVCVPVPILTWCLILLVGPFVHLAFNWLLYRLGVKARPA